MRQHHVEAALDTPTEGPRFERPGRLAPQLGMPAADQVRAQCDNCGTHLLAVPLEDGRLAGTCPVCLTQAVTPVGAHHAAA